MKTLYNEHLAYNKEGNEVCAEAWAIVRKFLCEQQAKGYNLREVSHMLQSITGVAESELIMRAALKKRYGNIPDAKK